MDQFNQQSFGKTPRPEQGYSGTSLEKPSLSILAHRIEEARGEEEARQAINEFLELFPKELNVEFSPDVTSIYRAMEQEGILVRLEKLSAVMDDLTLGKPIRLGEAGSGHYANAVIPKNEGIKIALAEGMDMGIVRFIMAFDVKSVVGFDPEGLQISEIDASTRPDASVRAELCRHVRGNLIKEQIKYLILRMPFHLVQEDHLTDKEIENTPEFIFRGARLAKVEPNN